jgi:hypothetical protein
LPRYSLRDFLITTHKTPVFGATNYKN